MTERKGGCTSVADHVLKQLAALHEFVVASVVHLSTFAQHQHTVALVQIL